MAKWEELVSLALLGTEQQKMPALGAESDGAVGELLAKLEAAAGKSRESVLLCAAGTLSLHGRAGQVPATIPVERMVPAAEDDLPLCGHIGVANLRLLLDQYSQTLLPLWLKAVAEAGRRVPETAVPMLLEFVENRHDLRADVVAVIGHRGRWLALQNPDWSFAADGDVADIALDKLKDIFETGTTEERLSALREARRNAPEAAREMVASTWAEDSHDVKVKFLEVLAGGLTMADEPFLEEKALDDKRKEVRLVAARLLATLTESRFHKRMVERALPLLKVKTVLLVKKEFDISLPQSADAAMLRDGFTKKGAQLTPEDRQEWMFYLMSAIDPSVWEREFKMTPEEIVQSPQPPNYIRVGWAAAAALHKNTKWIEAFCSSDRPPPNYVDLIVSSTPEVRERTISKMIAKNGGQILLVKGSDFNQPITTALLAANHDWSVDFARKLMPGLKALMHADVFHYSKQQLLGAIGFYFPPSLLPEAEQALMDARPEMQAAVDTFLSSLKFKSDLFGEIK